MDRKIEELASDLDDLSVVADELTEELKEETSTPGEKVKVDELRDGLERARDIVDDIVEDESDND
jgi:hypothetical protein